MLTNVKKDILRLCSTSNSHKLHNYLQTLSTQPQTSRTMLLLVILPGDNDGSYDEDDEDHDDDR